MAAVAEVAKEEAVDESKGLEAPSDLDVSRGREGVALS